jgi:hypothetical protein
MYSLLMITENIASELQKQLNNVTMRWKDSDATDVFHESKPTVYAFTYDDLTNNMPLKTPSVLVQCMSLDNAGVASFLVHVCICNPAKQDKEITNPVAGSDGVYQYGSGQNIDTSGVRSELYRACLMLGEQVYIALKKIYNSSWSVDNLQLDTPNPYLENFPYCECSVTFTVATAQGDAGRISTAVWDCL